MLTGRKWTLGIYGLVLYLPAGAGTLDLSAGAGTLDLPVVAGTLDLPTKGSSLDLLEGAGTGQGHRTRHSLHGDKNKGQSVSKWRF